MPGPLKTYDPAGVFLLIGGNRITGFAEDSMVEYEAGAPRGTLTVGADGETAFNRSNNKLVTARITLMETARSCKVLDDLARAQHAGPGSIAPLTYSMQDINNGDRISEQYATIIDDGMPSKGAQSGTRTFEIALPNGRDNKQLASTVSI